MKEKLRQFALSKRKGLDIKMISAKVMSNLFALDCYQKAHNIMCYFSLKYEIQTQSCLSDESKNWFLPRVNGENIVVCPYDKRCISKGSFNIQEPTNLEIKNLNIIDMVIIPAVAVDKNGYRLGYGKGYYDRFLPKLNQSCKKVILSCSDFVFDSVFPSEFDIKADIIVTDKDILRV